MAVLLALPIIGSTGTPLAQPASLPNPSTSPQGNQAKPVLSPQETGIADPSLILIQLDALVVDRNNQQVLDLTKDDFTVYEDKIKQTIEVWSIQDAPVSFGIVIDTSGSMHAKLPMVKNAVLTTIKQMLPDDEAFILYFKKETFLAQDFTRDHRKLEEALGPMSMGGPTSLFDTLILAIQHTQEKGQQRRKALVVITDGLEKTTGLTKEKEALAAISKSQVQVYFIGLHDEDSGRLPLFIKSPSLNAKERLARLAKDSGGRAYFPPKEKEVIPLASRIITDLHRQHLLGYYPTNEKSDGTFRNVRVEVHPKDHRNLTVFTRPGYYAPVPKT